MYSISGAVLSGQGGGNGGDPRDNLLVNKSDLRDLYQLFSRESFSVIAQTNIELSIFLSNINFPLDRNCATTELEKNELQNDFLRHTQYIVENWIENFQYLKLRFLNSYSSDPHFNYQSIMLNLMQTNGSTRTIIRFNDKKLLGPVQKICINFKDQKSGNNYIDCNTCTYRSLPDNLKRFLIHHEYAGLAGYEVSDGAESRYWLSIQFASFSNL